MFGKYSKQALLLLALPTFVFSVAPTDEYRDADESQSSYLPNHNMDPNIVGSNGFGILWQKKYTNDRFFAKPLTFTSAKGLNGNKQVVIVASAQNNIYIEDAKAGGGATIATRFLYDPYSQADTGNCPDLGGPAGIIGTPSIDPTSEIMYFYAKGYKNGGTGLFNGAYRLHAIDLNDPKLNDIPGYPLMIDGSYADNDPSIYFNGGPAMQRPATLLKNGILYAGFGSYCDKFNFTGAVISVSLASPPKVVSYFSTEISPYLPAGRLDMTGSSGQGGIWMGGSGLASDGNRLFFTTGNGKGKQNSQGSALSGKYPLATLSESAINLAIGPGGKLTIQDWFQPFDYAQYDNYDEDLGSAGITLLDTTTFKGTGVSRMALTYGKNNYMYVLNADNLGGFGNGPGKGDAVIQTISAGATTFGGSGSYPLDGGYIYFVPSGAPLTAMKLGFDSNGVPSFNPAGTSDVAINGRIGPPTTTSFQGKTGTGIVWVADNNAGLLAFKAVPQGGKLVPIPLPATGGLGKFQRPAFGDGRVYVTNSNGVLYCMGSPVNLAVNCTSLDFGDSSFGSTKTQTVSCTALTQLTKVNFISVADPQFTASNSSLPQGSVAANSVFTFDVTYKAPTDSDPGLITSSITLSVTPNSNTFTNSVPIGLQANLVSSNAYIQVIPANYIFDPIIIGDASAGNGVQGQFVLANGGQQTLTISGYAYSIDGGNTFANLTHNATNNQYWSIGQGFNLETGSLPAIGSTLAQNVQTTVKAHFYAINGNGTYNTAFFVYSNGGKTARVTFSGAASAAPRAEVSFANGEGGWDFTIGQDFGSLTAAPGKQAVKTMRVCNRGGSDLVVTKSKPISNQYFFVDDSVVFPEGQIISPNQCTLGNVTFVPGTALVNTPSISTDGVFILNFNDPYFNGPIEYPFTATATSLQVGVLKGGVALYGYAGCYQDAKCGTSGNQRCLTKQTSNANMNAEFCINYCNGQGYGLAAVEYHTECWCGNTVPYTQFIDNTLGTKCAYSCPGDVSGGLERCGGDGTLMNMYYNTDKYANIYSSASTSSTTTTTQPTSTSTQGPISSGTTISTTVSTITGVTTSTTTSTAPTTTPTGPVHVPAYKSWTYQGCYAEPTGSKALPKQVGTTNAATMSVEYCLDLCASLSSTYMYAGLEYAQECYCGAALNTAAQNQTDFSKCKSTCKGNSGEYCGAGNFLDLYRILPSSTSSLSTTTSRSSTSTSAPVVVSTSTTSSSSVTSLTSSSSSSTSTSSTSSSTSSSVTSATSTSSSSTTSLTGTVSTDSTTSITTSTTSSTGSASSLTSTTTTSSTLVTSTSTSSSTSTSASSSTTSSSVSASTTSSSSATSPSTTTTTSTSSIPASTTSSSNSVPTTMITTTKPSTTTLSPSTTSSQSYVSGYASLGCFVEPPGAKQWTRILANNSMNVELCLGVAKAHNPPYEYVGLEYGIECWAGHTSFSYTTTTKGCTKRCSGNTAEYCGQGNQFNLYIAAATSAPSS